MLLLMSRMLPAPTAPVEMEEKEKTKWMERQEEGGGARGLGTGGNAKCVRLIIDAKCVRLIIHAVMARVRFLNVVCTVHLSEIVSKPSWEAKVVRGVEEREMEEKVRVNDRGEDKKEIA